MAHSLPKYKSVSRGLVMTRALDLARKLLREELAPIAPSGPGGPGKDPADEAATIVAMGAVAGFLALRESSGTQEFLVNAQAALVTQLMGEFATEGEN